MSDGAARSTTPAPMDELTDLRNRLRHADARSESLADKLWACQDRADAAEARTAALVAALREIAALGRVCDDFEFCDHPACADSCGAVLIALDALAASQPEGASPAADALPAGTARSAPADSAPARRHR